MRILMLANRESTFPASFFDYLYGGLRGLLGAGNVHVYPYPSAYSSGITDPKQASFMTWNFPNAAKPLPEVLELARSGFYELLVIGIIPFEQVQDDYLEIIQVCNCPIVAINSSDCPDMWDFETYLGKPLLAEFRKEAFTANGDYELQSHGMRFDFATDSFPTKGYDVCAIFGEKEGSPVATIRKQIVARIKDAFPGSVAEYTSTIPYYEYLNFYRGAWIGLSMRGIGIHTLRIYEIVGAKTFCLSDPFPVIVPDWFVEGSHIEYYDSSDLDSMEHRIRTLLEDKQKLRERIEDAYCHLWTYHNIYHNAERFLSIVSSKLEP